MSDQTGYPETVKTGCDYNVQISSPKLLTRDEAEAVVQKFKDQGFTAGLIEMPYTEETLKNGWTEKTYGTPRFPQWETAE